jgi:hypothetical protein
VISDRRLPRRGESRGGTPGHSTANIQRLKTTIKASDAKQQQIYSRLWCREGFVNKTDDYSDDSPLDEVSHSLHQSEFQPMFRFT